MSLSGKSAMTAHWKAAAAALAGVALSACSASAPEPVIPDVSAYHAPSQPRLLDAGQTVKIVAFGVDGLSGDYRIDADGALDLGRYGKLPAAGMSAPRLEEAIAARLAEKGRAGVRVSVMRVAD